MERTTLGKAEMNENGLPSIGIPAEILFHPELSNTEKILFGFIRNLAYTILECLNAKYTDESHNLF